MPSYALIAEADAACAEQYRGLVAAEGVQAIVARDGAAARAVFEEKGPPALLICDLSLPRLDGFALLALLRKVTGPDRTPALVACAFRELREAAGRLREPLGIGAILAKPAPLDQLRRSLKRALAVNFSMRASSPGLQLPVPLPAPAAELPRHALRPAVLLPPAPVDRSGEPPEPELTPVLAEAAAALGVQSAVLTLCQGQKHSCKAWSGPEPKEPWPQLVEQGWSFGQRVVDAGAVLLVPDAQGHPLFGEEPLVKSGQLRGLVAAPLPGPDGASAGALLFCDPLPLALGAEAVETLQLLVRRLAGELELRRGSQRRRTILRRDEEERLGQLQAPIVAAPLPWLLGALDAVDSGILLLDAGRRVVEVNRTLAAWLGRDAVELCGLTLEQLLGVVAEMVDDPADLLRRLRVSAQGPFSLREEVQLVRPRRRRVRFVGSPVSLPETLGHVLVVHDLTAESDLLHERQELARTDPLTGLANRRGGQEGIQREVSRSERGGFRLSFALFDIDQFHLLCESKGEPAGDDAVRAVVRVLLANVRGADLLVRWGGDEILAVLPQTGLEGARSLGERVRAGVEALSDPEFGHITLFCGVAELHQGEDEGEALARAEEKLQAAKAAGRNRVQ